MSSGFYRLTVGIHTPAAEIVNVFHYRVTGILPALPGWGGADDLADTFAASNVSKYVTALPSSCMVTNLSVTAFDNAYQTITGSAYVKTVNAAGSNNWSLSSSALTATVSWVLDNQVQINGSTKPKRNRGYTSFGPMAETWVSDSGLIVQDFIDVDLEPWANSMRSLLTSVLTGTVFVPIRIHEIGSLLTFGRTYSDILGYKLPTHVSTRRSRLYRS